MEEKQARHEFNDGRREREETKGERQDEGAGVEGVM